MSRPVTRATGTSRCTSNHDEHTPWGGRTGDGAAFSFSQSANRTKPLGMRNFLTALADRIEAAVNCAGRVTQWLVPLFVLLAFTGTILRHAFGLGSVFLQESVLYLHATAFLVGAAVALMTDRHVRVDIFYRDASPRRKALVDMIGGIVALLPFCAVVAYTALPYAARSWAILEQSRETTGVPLVFLLKSLIVGYAVILGLQGLATTIRNGLRLAVRQS